MSIDTVSSGDAEWQAYSAYYANASFFGKPFDNEFWRDLVIQVGDQEPSIRYAIFALGHLARQFDLDQKLHGGDCTCPHCRTALTSYNKAISQITNRQFTRSKIHVPLISCVLFIGLEFMQGNTEKGLMLLGKGNELFCKVFEDGSPELAPTLDLLRPIFERLQLTSHLFGHRIHQLTRSLPVTPTDRETGLEDVTPENLREMLFDIMARAYELLKQALAQVSEGLGPSQLDRDVILEELQQWTTLLQSYRTRHGQCLSFDDIYKLAVLECFEAVSKIWLFSINNIGAAGRKDLDADFARVVNTAGSVLEPLAEQSKPPPFTFEMSFLPLLYFTASRCRQPAIRRRALALLRLTSARESAWERSEMIFVTKRLIEVEEAEAGIVGDDPADFDSDYSIRDPSRLMGDIFIGPEHVKDAHGREQVLVTYKFQAASHVSKENLQEWVMLDPEDFPLPLRFGGVDGSRDSPSPLGFSRPGEEGSQHLDKVKVEKKTNVSPWIQTAPKRNTALSPKSDTGGRICK